MSRAHINWLNWQEKKEKSFVSFELLCDFPNDFCGPEIQRIWETFHLIMCQLIKNSDNLKKKKKKEVVSKLDLGSVLLWEKKSQTSAKLPKSLIAVIDLVEDPWARLGPAGYRDV